MQIPHPAMIGLLSGEHYIINYPNTPTDIPHECRIYDYAASDWNYYF